MVISSWHRSDGYPEWLGIVLTEFYRNPSDARSLVDGGDMESCFTDAGFDNTIIWEKNGRPSRIFRPLYYCLEDKKDSKSIVHDDIDDYLSYCGLGKGVQVHKEWLEFAYLYIESGWICYDIFEGKKLTPPFIPKPGYAIFEILEALDKFARIDVQLKWEKVI